MGNYSHSVYTVFWWKGVDNLHTITSSRGIVIRLFLWLVISQHANSNSWGPKKNSFITIRGHILSRRTLQLCPTFHSAQSTPWCLTDLHSISEESKDNDTISCVFSLNALVYFSKNNRRMINRERKEKEDTCWTWYETQTNKLCDNLFKPYHPPSLWSYHVKHW